MNNGTNGFLLLPMNFEQIAEQKQRFGHFGLVYRTSTALVTVLNP